jgi:hypothetical protein
MSFERVLRWALVSIAIARLLARVVEDLPTEKVDRYLTRDAQRIIEAIETLVRMHTAQEEDIYDAMVARTLPDRHENRLETRAC